MFKLDNDFLTSMGLGNMPVDEKNRLLQMIYERLEMNVGMRLAEKMSDQQLDEFEGFIDRNDEAGALKWLESNFPNYKDVVAEELEKLKGEVQQSAPQILAASQVTNMQTPGQPGAPGSQMPPIGQPMMMPGTEQAYPGALPQQSAQSYGQAPQPGFGQPQPAPQPQNDFSQPQQPSFGQSQQPGGFDQPAPQQMPAQPYNPGPPMMPPAPAPQQPPFDPSTQPGFGQPVQPQQFQPPAQPFGPAPSFQPSPQDFSQPSAPAQPPFTPPTSNGFTPPPADFTPPQQ